MTEGNKTEIISKPSEEDEEDRLASEFEKEPTNPYVLRLEKTIREQAATQGIAEADAVRIDAATFTLRDESGNATDILKVGITHYKGMFSRPGVEGFELSPINGEKDAYGRDAKFVRGSFWGALQNTSRDAYGMTYAGNEEEIRQYVASAMQEDSLARADIQLHLPEKI